MIVKKTGWPRFFVTLLLLTTIVGCIGPMNATMRVRTWNREIENRWLGEGAYILLKVPYSGVYGLLALSDLLVFNSIEFWGGQNPIDPTDPARLKAVQELDTKRHGGGSKDVDDDSMEKTEE